MAISKNNRTMISMILISLFFLGISPAAAQDTTLADALSTIDDALSMLKDALSKLNDTSTGNDTLTGNDAFKPVECDSTSPDCCWVRRIWELTSWSNYKNPGVESASVSPTDPKGCCSDEDGQGLGGRIVGSSITGVSCTSDGNVTRINWWLPHMMPANRDPNG